MRDRVVNVKGSGWYLIYKHANTRRYEHFEYACVYVESRYMDTGKLIRSKFICRL